MRGVIRDIQPVSSRVSTGVWWLCAVLFFAAVLNYLDRQVLSLTADKIVTDFGLTNEGIGRTFSAFRYSYGIFQIIGGPLVDAYGPRSVYPVAAGIWSMAGMLTGLSTSAGMLSGFRFLLGAGEALYAPCALKAIHRLLPSGDRPLAIGIFNSGAAAGAFVAPVIVTLMTLFFGWRAAFVATGALGGFWILAWFWCSRPYSQELGRGSLPLSVLLKATKGILCKRDFWLLAVSAVVINSISFFLADWIPLYLKTVRGFSFATGNILSIVIYAALGTGNILMGLLIRKLVSAGLSLPAARKWSLAASCVLMSTAVVAGLTSSRSVAVVCLASTALGVTGFLVVYLTLVQDLEPLYVGISSGLLGGIGNLAYGFCSPFIGRLADLRQAFLVLVLLGVLPWLAFVTILGAARPETK